MTKKTSEMVAYVGEGKIIVGPLSSESDMLEYCFLRSARKVSNFDRKVLPYEGLGDLILKAKCLLAEAGFQRKDI